MTDIPTGKLFKNLPIAIILPVILTVILFFLTIFLLVLPALESALMSQRRGLIHELTETALSTLHHYHLKEASGELTRQEAQSRAVSHLRELRYGVELKDYFWINDMTPRIIMHPYRTDLEGRDVSDYKDPNGKRLFVEFAKVVREKGDGYVDYQWQWKDDPLRIVPKISFVKGFTPWNWVVGTGIYIEDIQEEISGITKKLTLICLGILLFVFVLSVFIIWQGVKVEKERKHAEERARFQQEQLYQAGKMATVGTLAAGVAHEINNPVTAILLNAPIVKEMWNNVVPMVEKYRKENELRYIQGMDFTELFARTPQLLEDIEDGGRRIRNIVNELKDFARLSPPELNEDVNINIAVEKSVALVSNLIGKSTDHFKMNCRPDIPKIKGNAQKVEQVMINLLVNACQALLNKTQAIEISTEHDKTADKVIVTVRDEGDGIPSATLARIKDPFFTTKQSSGSTGLGLAISDKIMKDHGATMEILSSVGEGTTAILSFPAHRKSFTEGKI